MNSPSPRVLCLSLALLSILSCTYGATSNPSSGLESPAAPPARPMRGEWAALSPDGHRIAYSVREGDTLGIVVATVATPTQVLSRVSVANTATAAAVFHRDPSMDVPRINWIRWVSPTRIVIETNTAERGWSFGTSLTSAYVPPAPHGVIPGWTPGGARADVRGFVLGFNADGSDARVLMTPQRAGGSIDVVGIDPQTPHHLVVTAAGFDFAVDVETGDRQRMSAAAAQAVRRAEAVQVQRREEAARAAASQLAHAIPGTDLAVVDATATGDRLLVLPRGGAPGGAVYVFDRTAQRVLAFTGSGD